MYSQASERRLLKSLPKGISLIKSRKVIGGDPVGYRVRIRIKGKAHEKRFWFSSGGRANALREAIGYAETLRKNEETTVKGLYPVKLKSGGVEVCRWSANYVDAKTGSKRRKVFPFSDSGKAAAVEFLKGLNA